MLLTKKEVIKAGKKLGLFITENSGADYAAKNLLECNKRLCELETIMALPNDQIKSKFNAYCKKWGVK